jgi:hypothetical protein
MTPKPISRQRLWQIQKRKEGKCVTCAKPANGLSQCDECAKRNGVRQRHAERKALWEVVDWTRTTNELTKEFGITPSAVSYRRKQFGIQSTGRGRPRKQKPTTPTP